MRYEPRLTAEEIEGNHKRFLERVDIYKKHGYDIDNCRDSVLKKAGILNGNILEIGTGRGHTALALARAGHDIITIDREEDPLKTAALNLAYEGLLSKVTFHVMDARSIDFPDTFFKNIIAVNLIHHLDGVDRVFSEIDRLLTPGGKFIIADFNKRGMGMLDIIHKNEGRVHEDSGYGKGHCNSYFTRLGYKIQGWEEEFYWVLTAVKSS